MKTLAEIFYDAIQADTELMEAIGNRVVSTCFEVPPGGDDNTPVPNIILIHGNFQNGNTTKDCVWEADEDMVQVTVDIAAKTDGDVEILTAKVRKVINDYITTMYTNGQAIPQLQPGFPIGEDIAWDWMKPCYYQKITYQCITEKYTEDEQEKDN